MVTRGVITIVNDGLKTQGLQVTLRYGEVADDVEHMQPWGLSFRPTRGSECVVFAVGGAQDHLVALGATNREHRPADNVEAGEGGLYTDTGWKVFLAADDTVNLGAKSPDNALARADRVEVELTKIKATLDSLVGGSEPPAEFTVQYGDVGSVGADKVKGE
jgi:phage baseplate assembly protein V